MREGHLLDGRGLISLRQCRYAYKRRRPLGLYISLPLQPATMHLACVLMKMSLDEALAGATLNAAYSLGRERTHGSLEVGKVADMVVVDAPR